MFNKKYKYFEAYQQDFEPDLSSMNSYMFTGYMYYSSTYIIRIAKANQLDDFFNESISSTLIIRIYKK